MSGVLVVIDCQNDFVTGVLSSKEALNVAKNVEKKIKGYIERKEHIFFTYDTHQKNYLSTNEGKHLPVEHCIEGTKGHELYGEFEKIANSNPKCHKILKKSFGSVDLPYVIKSSVSNITSIEICGLVTDICVISNIAMLKAHFPEIPLLLDPECCAGTTPEMHKKTLDVMKSLQVDFTIKKQQKIKSTAEKTEEIIKWIRNIKETTKAKGFVIGISGGKDSSVVATLLSKSVGKENVLGILMPNGVQSDIQDSKDLCDFLQIPNKTVNIEKAYNGLLEGIETELGAKTKTNIPPRIRMTVLYAIAQQNGYLVCGTGNASEKYIGYFTKWGDGACDINPIGNLNTEEVIAIGEYLGLPEKFTRKAPSDGLCGKTDEDNIGFTYAQLNKYIKTGECEDKEVKAKIESMHASSIHKVVPIPVYEP